jgi:hypothetical protein
MSSPGHQPVVGSIGVKVVKWGDVNYIFFNEIVVYIGVGLIGGHIFLFLCHDRPDTPVQ